SATSTPSFDGQSSSTALRYTRGLSGPVFSSRNRRASGLGLPESDAAFGPRTANRNDPSSSPSFGLVGSGGTLTPPAVRPCVSVFALPISSSNRARSTSSAILFDATACIWLRFGRLPSRQVPGNSPPSGANVSSSQWLTWAQRSSPFSSSILSGRQAATSTV